MSDKKYIATSATPLADWPYDYVSYTADTVIFEEPLPIKTGLLNEYGVPLYRVTERVPIGFKMKG